MKILALAVIASLTASSAPAAFAAPNKPADVLVTVNGTKVRRAEVQERLWQRYATQALNEVVDDLLVEQAVKSLGIKADSREVDTRLKRIQGQFPDEGTFKQRLASSGGTLKALKEQIQGQVLREALLISAAGIKITDADVRSFFDANKDKLGSPEAVRARHLLVASEKEAQDFLVALRAGADFVKLAGSVSLDAQSKPQGGDLGFIARGMVVPEIETAVMALKPGEVSGPVKTALGWHLFKAEERRAASPADFAQIKGDLASAILADRLTKAWPDYIKELRQKAKLETP